MENTEINLANEQYAHFLEKELSEKMDSLNKRVRALFPDDAKIAQSIIDERLNGFLLFTKSLKQNLGLLEFAWQSWVEFTRDYLMKVFERPVNLTVLLLNQGCPYDLAGDLLLKQLQKNSKEMENFIAHEDAVLKKINIKNNLKLKEELKLNRKGP